jgi:hypothetical protein
MDIAQTLLAICLPGSAITTYFSLSSFVYFKASRVSLSIFSIPKPPPISMMFIG